MGAARPRASRVRPALTWDQLREMRDSGLCTIGNHTHTHVRPERADHRRAGPLHRDRGARSSASCRGTSPTPGACRCRGWTRRCASGSRPRPPASSGATSPGSTRCCSPASPCGARDPLEFFRAKLHGGLAARADVRRDRRRRRSRLVLVADDLRAPAPLHGELRTGPAIRTADGRPLRVAHLTTVDMSLALLLGKRAERRRRGGPRDVRHLGARAVRASRSSSSASRTSRSPP